MSRRRIAGCPPWLALPRSTAAPPALGLSPSPIVTEDAVGILGPVDVDPLRRRYTSDGWRRRDSEGGPCTG